MASLTPNQSRKFTIGENVEYYNATKNEYIKGKVVNYISGNNKYCLEISGEKGVYTRDVDKSKINKIAKQKFSKLGEGASQTYSKPSSHSHGGGGGGGNTKRSNTRLITFNKQISAAGKGRDLQKAERIFASIFEDGLRPDVFSYSSLMNAAIKAKKTKRAFELFDSMKSVAIEPTAITYSTLIEIAIASNDIERALFIYTQGSDLLAPTIQSNPQRLDLHGASLAVSKAAILFHRNQQTLPNIIVEGKGNHSENDPVLREGIPTFLNELSIQHQFDPENDGRIILNLN